jgi:hypothetical protein
MLMRTWFSRFALRSLLLLLLPACSIKRISMRDYSVRAADIPVFIELPKNDLVFENISPLVYEIFTEHFERVGYRVMEKAADGYTLGVTIKRLDPSYRYISPDIVLFHTTILLELLVQLHNYKGDVVAQKSFTYTTLISKPQNPILNSDFLDFEYTRLLKKAAPKVEQYFRPFLLKSTG